MVFLSTVEVITHESKTQKKRSRNSDARWKPAAVILDIEEYRALLERVEDMEDLKMLREMRKRQSNSENWQSFYGIRIVVYEVLIERSAEKVLLSKVP
jgi:hypothetical protein